jgi:hypothetical protein
MKLKKNIPFLVVCLGILFLVYFFTAVRPLGRELQITPKWTIPVARNSGDEDTAVKLPFRLGQTIGYFTPDGKISSITTFPYKAAISESFFAVYGPDDSSIPIYTAAGELSGTIKKSGFPFIQNDRIYLFLPGGSSFDNCASDGSVTWSYEGTMPVTAFSASEAGCVAGFADGTVKVFDRNGTIVQDYAPGGSNYQVILGAGISASGDYTACVSGQDQQRFVLVKHLAAQNKIVLHEYLPGNVSWQVLVKFSRNGRFVCYNYKDGLGIADVETKEIRHLPLKGRIVEIEESGSGKPVYILSRTGSTYTVSILEAFKHIAGSFSFTADTAFIIARDGDLFIGKDGTISRMTITKE